ncbi:RNA 2',3'-cyclic phosphodiesterase [Candidatus Poribacteria bacterium]|jgi:RNA 2',3'-cyclic 3'-phosphodiesterase|nr:RNA 2',3'-cyclic phosphodiesterase [Candidatus Poribacteria bacterium]MBT5713775.1 RNA 2',3'-cyclic phosphodiesterase [Candidatus Poribacteria bacterium]MBT7808814.1 RNA 2',3'-cyclic phosphodiesterase [Candidatus Poribacteria bacterium]
MRLFVALMLPRDAQERIRSVCRAWPELRQRYRARPAAEYHFTLKFLGDVDPVDAQAVADALDPAFDGIRAFHVALNRLGAFATAERASVLWWGAEAGADGLKACARRVEDALEPLGFDREKRTYVPHVTLARFRPPAQLGDWLDEKNGSSTVVGSDAPRFEASEISLVRSELTRQGARYTQVRAYALGR